MAKKVLVISAARVFLFVWSPRCFDKGNEKKYSLANQLIGTWEMWKYRKIYDTCIRRIKY